MLFSYMKYPGIFDTEFLFNLIGGIEVCDGDCIFGHSILIRLILKHSINISPPDK